ncbi:EcsC family protein [Pontivivens insulae]|uniref:EcsC protein family protein n=1 Tax=Pontivivens insulae TaxID=1639689 RepID=A0A2R8AEW0_9RHOB|nr:EcsC family protein [Pontivivens insulae]RED11881.1 EcsC family protein [Pontivivens insulae]SPF30638.1 hypothetical protein POI8812_02978 [Pontivivens insulae]
MNGPKDTPGHPLSVAVERVLAEQRSFEQQRATRMGRGVEAATAPIGEVARRLIPASVVRTALDGADRAAGYTVPEDISGHDVNDIAACDAAALRAQGWAMGMNAATGAGAGLFGVVGLSVDIPGSIAIAARNVRATGLAYGFTGQSEEERIFRLAILELAATGGMEERAASVARVNRLAQALGQAGGEATLEGIDWALDKVVERATRALGMNLAQRKAAQVVPILSAALGAAVNASFQTDVARAARYAYRQRWLATRQMLPAPETAA